MICAMYMSSLTAASWCRCPPFARRTCYRAELVNRFNIFPAAKVLGDPASGLFFRSGDCGDGTGCGGGVVGKRLFVVVDRVGLSEKLTGGASTRGICFRFDHDLLILAAQYEKNGRCRLWSFCRCRLRCWAHCWPFICAVFKTTSISRSVLVTLIGLAAKNAILIVEFAVMRVQNGMTYAEAAVSAAKLRFRPIGDDLSGIYFRRFAAGGFHRCLGAGKSCDPGPG